MKGKTKQLAESAMLITLALVLEVVSRMVIPELPFGGRITLVSMLPIVLISYRYGVKWGLLSALAYAFVQMALGGSVIGAAFMPGYFGDGAMIGKAIAMCLLDYLLAYTALGLGGLFRNRIQKPGVSLMCGSLVALGIRYCFHILSGYILFAGWAEWFFGEIPGGEKVIAALNPTALGFVYSVVYNGMYMIPEIILTAIASVLIAKIPGVLKKM